MVYLVAGSIFHIKDVKFLHKLILYSQLSANKFSRSVLLIKVEKDLYGPDCCDRKTCLSNQSSTYSLNWQPYEWLDGVSCTFYISGEIENVI